TPEQAERLDFPLRTTLVVAVDFPDELERVPDDAVVLSGDEEILKAAQAEGRPTCLSLCIESHVELEQAWQRGIRYDSLVVDFDLPTNIPLELLIARLQHAETA